MSSQSKPSELEIALLSDFLAVAYARRCAERVRPMLTNQLQLVCGTLEYILATFDTLDTATANRLGECQRLAIEAMGISEAWEWEGYPAFFSVLAAIQATQMASLNEEGFHSDLLPTLASTAFKAGINALSAVEKASNRSNAVSEIQELQWSDYKNLVEIDANEGKLSYSQICAILDA